ncbi:exported hypothetical protein [Verrucomicrobia bacterium]|nr:exported hypothetical protein [Verrucomicrobiota bacterium]
MSSAIPRWVSHLIVLVLLALAPTLSALSQGWALDSGIEVRKAVVPVYLNFEPEPAAILRADRIFSDYQRKGLFRIGVLPVLVLDGLIVELRDAARLTNALSEMSAQFALRPGAKKAVEGRRFTLFFAAKEDGRISAKLVRLESASEWRLKDGTVQQPGVAPLVYSEGTLTVAGAQAGEFFCQTTNGAVRLDLLSLLSKKQHYASRPK